MKTQWDELDSREHRRLRRRRRGRRAYLRSIYSLPSLATLGNAICGFGAIYISAMPTATIRHMPIYFVAAYLIFLAMFFDAIDGRLARFARHTTDFGGQLDSLADAVSFGAALAFLAMLLFKHEWPNMPESVGRLVWAIGALYLSCALLRLARFNVSNQHGEQHHFSFLGLPSPAAAALIASFVLMQQEMRLSDYWVLNELADLCALLLPGLLLAGALLMVSTVRYPHLINRYLRGQRSLARVVSVLIVLLLIVVAHRYAIALLVMIYVIYGLVSSARYLRRAPHG